jgi:hypothetical protein
LDELKIAGDRFALPAYKYSGPVVGRKSEAISGIATKNPESM